MRNIHPEAYHSTHSDILRLDGAGGYWDSWDEATKHDTKAKIIVDKYYYTNPNNYVITYTC